MTPLLDMLMTAGVLILGVSAILYALRFFPIAKTPSDQFELDLDAPRDYARTRSAMAHSVDRMTDTIREETKRMKAKPRLK